MSIIQENIEMLTPISPPPPVQEKKPKHKYPCEECEGKLTIPYYFDPDEEIYICEECEKKSKFKGPLIKLKDKKYAADTAFTYFCRIRHKDMSQNIDDESRLPKYYAQMKEMFIKHIRDTFNERIN